MVGAIRGFSMRRHPLLKLMIVNWLLGMIAGLLCAVIVLLLDVGHLRSLLENSDLVWPGLILLFGGFALTFGGVVCATAVMFLPAGPQDAEP